MYRPVSIKMQERDGRRRSNRIIIKSVKSRIPCDFKEFLQMVKTNQGKQNKKHFVIKKEKVLNNLRATKLVLSEEGKTTVITLGKTYISDTLSSDQKEADTKFILHCHDALKENSNGSIILRSASSVTSILVQAVAHLYNEKQRVCIDSGRSTSRKVYWMEDIVMSEDEVNSLISFHTLAGNDCL